MRSTQLAVHRNELSASRPGGSSASPAPPLCTSTCPSSGLQSKFLSASPSQLSITEQEPGGGTYTNA